MMKIYSFALTFIVLFFMGLSPAHANERDDVDALFAAWQVAVSSGHPEQVVDLYDKDAILVPTLAPNPVSTQEGRFEYFSHLMQKPNLKVEINSEIYQKLDRKNAVISGLYDFKFDGGHVPARYTFVFEKKHGNWVIVEHHSSMIPDTKS
jgi:hypothetical protein